MQSYGQSVHAFNLAKCKLSCLIQYLWLKTCNDHAASRSHTTNCLYGQNIFGSQVWVFCVHYKSLHLLFWICQSYYETKSNSCNDMPHMISLYENTVIFIKWINIKVNKISPLVKHPSSRSPPKRIKIVFLRWDIRAFLTCRQVYFSRTCGMFSNSVLPAEGGDAWPLARLLLEPRDPAPDLLPVLWSSKE